MIVIWVRHGEYEFEEDGELTREGKKEIERTAKQLRVRLLHKRNILILSSPKKRAVQSAEIIFKELSKTRKSIAMKIDERLDVDGDGIWVDDIEKEFSEAKIVILVTHLPIIEDCYGGYLPKGGWAVEEI